jgi:hypothetical protein
MSQKPVASKITITYVKGKPLKKVIAVNPKCSAGFKKKKATKGVRSSSAKKS